MFTPITDKEEQQQQLMMNGVHIVELPARASVQECPMCFSRSSSNHRVSDHPVSVSFNGELEIAQIFFRLLRSVVVTDKSKVELSIETHPTYHVVRSGDYTLLNGGGLRSTSR